MNIRKLPSFDCNRIESLIRVNPLFSSLDSHQMERLCSKMKITSLRENDFLFKQGDPLHSFYFVIEGIIKIYRLSPDGHEKIIEIEKPGQTFAEALMFFHHPLYPVSAVAMEDSVVLAIQSSVFLEILEKSSRACMQVMGALSHRLHELINEIEHLSLMTGRNRVAMYILNQSMQSGAKFNLEIPKNAIASMLSVRPETFSRLIKELTSHRVIEMHENHIKVLDMGLLKKYAGII
jgi:CRP-like cAMP-binding protein